MTQTANQFRLATALRNAFGSRDAANKALRRAGIEESTCRVWLGQDGRICSVANLELIMGLVADPIAFLTDLGFAADQPWLRDLWRGAAIRQVDAAQDMARAAQAGLPHSLAARLRGLLPGKPAEYWVLRDGPQLAEEGLMLAAARYLEEDAPNEMIDYAALTRRMLGYISVIRHTNAPTQIAWDSTAVRSEALVQLLHALPAWDRGRGYRFENQVSDATLCFPTLTAACFEIERALGISRAASGEVLSPFLAVESASLDRADAMGTRIIEAWRDHRNSPADFAAALPADAEGYVCLYRMGDSGMTTDYHGKSLPPILGVPWDRLHGMPTALEPSHPEYRALYMSHLLESANTGLPSLYSIRGKVGSLSGGYRRLAVPFKHHADVCGILTFTSDIGGVECLQLLAC